MGKTPLPLTIVMDPQLNGPQFVGLREQGHKIFTFQEATAAKLDFTDVDVFLGPQCRWFTPTMLKYLDLTLKAARSTLRTKRANEKMKEATV